MKPTLVVDLLSFKRMILKRKPLGTFYTADGKDWVGLDNRYGRAMVKRFDKVEECVNWLSRKGNDEMAKLERAKKGNSWTEEEDKIVTEKVLECVRLGKGKSEAFRELSKDPRFEGRTTAAITGRWQQKLKKMPAVKEQLKQAEDEWSKSKPARPAAATSTIFHRNRYGSEIQEYLEDFDRFADKLTSLKASLEQSGFNDAELMGAIADGIDEYKSIDRNMPEEGDAMQWMSHEYDNHMARLFDVTEMLRQAYAKSSLTLNLPSKAEFRPIGTIESVNQIGRKYSEDYRTVWNILRDLERAVPATSATPAEEIHTNTESSFQNAVADAMKTIDSISTSEADVPKTPQIQEPLHPVGLLPRQEPTFLPEIDLPSKKEDDEEFAKKIKEIIDSNKQEPVQPVESTKVTPNGFDNAQVVFRQVENSLGVYSVIKGEIFVGAKMASEFEVNKFLMSSGVKTAVSAKVVNGEGPHVLSARNFIL